MECRLEARVTKVSCILTRVSEISTTNNYSEVAKSFNNEVYLVEQACLSAVPPADGFQARQSAVDKASCFRQSQLPVQ